MNKPLVTGFYSFLVWEAVYIKLILSTPSALKVISLFMLDTFSKPYSLLRKKDKS